MSDAFDLGRYFDRIGYGGPATPTLETLGALQRLQVAAIPFESLDPLLRRPVLLDLASLQAKLVASRRGGYCFELNGLFKAALETIGFQVTGLGGRVVWMSPPDAPLGGRTHMALLIDLPEGRFLADAGFGAHLLDAPLRFAPGKPQETPWARYRLVEADGRYTLETPQGEGWRRCYVLDLTPMLASDYAVSNWFTSTHPQMPFASTLIAERLTDDARFNLVNLRLTERRRDGEVTERTLASAAELAATLDQLFGIESPAPIADVFAKIGG